MSHFYASIQGSRGEATRQGSADSGIGGHIRGWNRGIDVRGFVNHSNNDQDCFHVRMTGGSNGRESTRLLLTVHEDGTVVPGDWLIEIVAQALGV